MYLLQLENQPNSCLTAIHQVNNVQCLRVTFWSHTFSNSNTYPQLLERLLFLTMSKMIKYLRPLRIPVMSMTYTKAWWKNMEILISNSEEGQQFRGRGWSITWTSVYNWYLCYRPWKDESQSWFQQNLNSKYKNKLNVAKRFARSGNDSAISLPSGRPCFVTLYLFLPILWSDKYNSIKKKKQYIFI